MWSCLSKIFSICSIIAVGENHIHPACCESAPRTVSPVYLHSETDVNTSTISTEIGSMSREYMKNHLTSKNLEPCPVACAIV